MKKNLRVPGLLACAALSGVMVSWPENGAHATAPTGCDTPAVVAKALPAVVNITATRLIRKNGEPAGIENFVGSGAIIDSTGVIVTNQHVIQDAIVVRVTFQDKTTAAAHLLGAASIVDLALVTVETPRTLPTLSFADSDGLKIGQPVIAIGNPVGVGTSVTTGSVSAMNRNLMRTPFDDFIQTDASINPGNSGGPLLDCDGNIVGIDTALISNNTMLGSIGLGFAMPSHDVMTVAKMLRDPGAVPNWIGVHLQDLTARLAKLFKAPGIEGAIVAGVVPDSPAAEASIMPGDVIIRVAGLDLPDARAIGRAVITHPSDQPMSLTLVRKGKPMDLELRGKPWPNFKMLESDVIPSQAEIAEGLSKGIGLHVAAASEADRKTYGLGERKGVLVDDVRPDSQAETVGLQKGDLIEQIGDQPAISPEQVMGELAYSKPDADDLIALLVWRKSGPQWITIWVGRSDSMEFVANREPSAMPGAARDAAAQQ